MASLFERLEKAANAAAEPEQTRDDFLDTYQSEHLSWASRALESDIKAPTAAKIAQGFVIEQPTHKVFNWWMHRADKRIAELEARVAWLEQKLLGIKAD